MNMNMNVSLTDELGEFVKARVSTGRYTSASEVVREALRLMERHEEIQAAKLKALQLDYAGGIASGDAGEIDFAGVKGRGEGTVQQGSQIGGAGSLRPPSSPGPGRHLETHCRR